MPDLQVKMPSIQKGTPVKLQIDAASPYRLPQVPFIVFGSMRTCHSRQQKLTRCKETSNQALQILATYHSAPEESKGDIVEVLRSCRRSITSAIKILMHPEDHELFPAAMNSAQAKVLSRFPSASETILLLMSKQCSYSSQY